jgi:hypothetical protein
MRAVCARSEIGAASCEPIAYDAVTAGGELGGETGHVDPARVGGGEDALDRRDPDRATDFAREVVERRARGDEGTFWIWFWYVEALACAGRVARAHLVFEKMLTYANLLGLYSEHIDALGNFPQAFTHLALISAAITLDQELR